LADRKTLTLTLAAAGILLAPLPANADHRRTPAAPTQSHVREGSKRASASPAKAVAPSATVHSAHASTGETVKATAFSLRAAQPVTRRPLRRHPRRITAHLASDPSVTIADFTFAPATITIHVGDTITWIDGGPSPHTATANNGNFDTGTLQKGQSGSHTFSQAGTFAYFCRIHPFMHGTVVVVANAASSGGSGSTSSAAAQSSTATSTATTASATTSSAPGLPNTGIDLLATVITGVLMFAAGVAIRRRLAAR
jgi:plastocyanin